MVMNAKSESPSEHRPSISLHRLQVNNWFKSEGGTERSPIEKPLDTPDHMTKRLEWVRKWFDLLTNPDAPVAFLDEKWFYVTNRRRKVETITDR